MNSSHALRHSRITAGYRDLGAGELIEPLRRGRCARRRVDRPQLLA